jgi:hypothetical protein
MVTVDGKQYVKVVRWFRFIAKDKSGRNNKYDQTDNHTVDELTVDYPYIWVKMTMLLERRTMPMIKYAEKIDNYWYHWNNGAINGWSGYLVDITAPVSGRTVRAKNWSQPINFTLVQNYVKASTGQKLKYYFAPKTYQITAENGKTYTITPQNKTYTQNVYNYVVERNTDRWNKMFCKYVYPHVYDNTYGQGVQFNPAKREIIKPSDSHEWKEADLKEILQNCAIIYDDELTPNSNSIRYAGVFSDSILYAEYNNVSTPIARLVSTNNVTATNRGKSEQITGNGSTYDNAGNIELIHWLPIGATFDTPGAKENVVLYDVLNAMGYTQDANGCVEPDKHRENVIYKQFRAWLGVIALQDCNLAKYVEQDKYDDDNKATVLSSWERPINLSTKPIELAIDANTDETVSSNIIYLIDYLKLFDWRGDYYNYQKQGYMYYDPDQTRNDNHWWFWAFYNVKGIKIDLRPEKVTTNMHQSNENTFVPMSTISTKVRLAGLAGMLPNENYFGEYWLADGTPVYTKNYGFTYNGWGLCDTDYLGNTANSFQYATREGAIEQYMEDHKEMFGGFVYENNGDNVTEFSVRIPITIYYEWGSFTQNVQWDIKSTHGQHNGL